VNKDLVALIQEQEFIRSQPAEDVARIVERRWASYGRRHPKPSSQEERVRDLAKGLRDRFEEDPSLGGGGVLREYEYFAERAAPLLDDL